mmetsp:Transcript_21377/g.54484  ORF Transcript_21377/g.54484 Transcript_21377/m.54484 type:complete len:428 (-) Transcript_21377:23-1306(-)
MLVGVDQVLLDLVVNVDGDPTVFERYAIQKDTQCLAEERHHALIADLLARAETRPRAAGSSPCGGCWSCVEGLLVSPPPPRLPAGAAGVALPPVRTTPGGVVCNSLRGAAWLLRQQAAAASAQQVPAIKMLGMVGRDKAADRLRKEMREAGVEPLFDHLPGDSGVAEGSPAASTGVCCCLIEKGGRTMVTDLRAGRTLELHGQKAPSWPGWGERIAAAQAGASRGPVLVILSAFYIQADPEGAKTIREWCAAAPGRVFAMTVSAEWCCHQPAVQDMARTADLMFGNEPETIELATSLAEKGRGTKPGSFEEAVATVARWKPQGWVIATRGAKSVEALHSSSSEPPLFVPVERVPAEEFVDDVGAGDAFMGGFCAVLWQRAAALPPDSGKVGLADRMSPDDVKAAMVGGIRAASAAVRCVGCQFGEHK